MIFIDKLGDFPKKFKTGYWSYKFEVFNSLRPGYEPKMMCFVYVDDKICVMKGYYDKEVTPRYSVHEKEIVNRFWYGWFIMNNQMVERWTNTVFWENTKEDAINRYYKIQADNIIIDNKRKETIDIFMMNVLTNNINRCIIS